MGDMTNNSVGNRIAELRRAAGMTQEKLAAKINVSRQSVSNWENGIQEPSVETLLRLCAALNVTASEFFAGIGESTVSPAVRQAAVQAEPASDPAVPASEKEGRKNKTINAILIASISILAFGLVVVGLLFFPAVTYARYGDYTKLSVGTLNITHGMVIFLGFLFVLMLILEMILIVYSFVKKKRNKKSVLSSRPDTDVK